MISFIMDYNRVVKDLGSNSPKEFWKRWVRNLTLKHIREGQFKPTVRHTFGMYMDGKWYKLTAKAGTYNEKDPVDRLDVSIIQNNLLGPVLGIKDPRTDGRIDFIGGIRGLGELEKRVNDGMKVAFPCILPLLRINVHSRRRKNYAAQINLV